MSEPVVVTEVRNRSLWIRLNRPDAMNSLTPEVLQAIDKALDQALESTDVMTVVLTGTSRAFSMLSKSTDTRCGSGFASASGITDW